MKLALREEMSRGGTLSEQLSWLEGLGFDGIELASSSLEMARVSSRRPSPIHRFVRPTLREAVRRFARDVIPLFG